jgi:hypothetical protein
VVIIGVVRLRAHRESHAPHRRGSPSHRLRRFQKASYTQQPAMHNSLLCSCARPCRNDVVPALQRAFQSKTACQMRASRSRRSQVGDVRRRKMLARNERRFRHLSSISPWKFSTRILQGTGAVARGGDRTADRRIRSHGVDVGQHRGDARLPRARLLSDMASSCCSPRAIANGNAAAPPGFTHARRQPPRSNDRLTVDSRRRSNVSNAQTAAIPQRRGERVKSPPCCRSCAIVGLLVISRPQRPGQFNCETGRKA